jgi:urease accessory protein
MCAQSGNQLPDYQITRLPDSRVLTRLPDSRAPEAIGRTARLELVFEARRGRTIVAHAYAEPPFRVGRTFELDEAAYVIITCSGPGIFAGDTLRQSIHVGGGACAVLTSQSALQVHPPPQLQDGRIAEVQEGKDKRLAVVEHEYHVADDGELHCHWDPVIPFAGARLEQRFDLRIAESSRLYWSDAVMAGRVSRGEAWRFQSLAHELRLRVGSTLAYLERYTLTPADRDIKRMWTAGDADYLATALVRHPNADAKTVEALHRDVAELAGVRAGVDLIEAELAVARFMGSNGASFSRARASYRTLAVRSIFGGPELVMRK